MTTGVERLNRVVLTLLGLLLSLGAAAGLAVGARAFGPASAHRRLLETQVSGYADRMPWFWWAVAAGTVLLGVLALTWLLAQGRSDRIGRVDLAVNDGDGVTVVHADAIAGAVEHEVGSFPGVTAASARLRQDRTRRVDLVIRLREATDLTELRDRVQRETVTNLRHVLDAPGLRVHVQLRPAAEERARVL
jgi:hypothetical protein